MGRSYDEPFTLYGLLAESIDTDAGPDLRRPVPAARGPIRRLAGDCRGRHVVDGDARHGRKPALRRRLTKIASMEKTGERSVRFTFNVEDRELPLITGCARSSRRRSGRARIAEATMEVPIGSGPYSPRPPILQN